MSFQLFRPLDAATEAALRASIERFGVLVPVAKDQHGRFLDGHQRSRLADEIGVKYRVDVITVADDGEAQEIARTLNADRRHLTPEQRREVAAGLREQGHSLRAIAGVVGVSQEQVRQDLSGVNSLTPDSVVGKDGKRYPARRPTVVAAKDEREAERAQTALATAELPASRVLNVRRVERIAREQTVERRRAGFQPAVTAHGDAEVRLGAFAEVLADLDGRADAIITDPPYMRDRLGYGEYDKVYDGLGELAARLLKPDGLLAVLTGSRLELLYDVEQRLARHVQRRCMCIYLTPGQRWRNHLERVAIGWKPLLVYSQPRGAKPMGEGRRWISNDVFTSEASRQDDRFHEWGQTETGFTQIVERLTKPGDLVVDPFLGGGTTAIVCKALGRSFVGCDIDAAAIGVARERLAK